MSSLQAALVAALRDCVNEFHRVLDSTNAGEPHFDGDRFHERLTAANAALAQAEAARNDCRCPGKGFEFCGCP